MSGLKDKVVIITGGSAGIGAATALAFVRVGARVVLMARGQEKLKEMAEKCIKEGADKNNVLCVVGDIMKDDDLKRVVDMTVDKYGGIDVLVNNAGIAYPMGFMTSTVDDMDYMYKMHVRSTYVLTKLATPYLIKRKGNVVNVSSIASASPLVPILPYSVAKCAQDHLMKAVALELAKEGVRLNSVRPGTVKTDLFVQGGIVKEDTADEYFEKLALTHPLQRLGTPDEIANVIVFLASDGASYVSGTALSVDSGKYLTTLE